MTLRLLVLGDATPLAQVICSCLMRLSLHPKNGRIKVQSSCIDGQIQIKATDTGQGRSRNFYLVSLIISAKPDSTNKQGGLGLGLAIARHLVELHSELSKWKVQDSGQGATLQSSCHNCDRHINHGIRVCSIWLRVMPV